MYKHNHLSSEEQENQTQARLGYCEHSSLLAKSQESVSKGE